MKELLDTDRVNYLIWRYLLESNYRDTAAKLQKEWRVHQPHKQLDFAQHVKTYALVNLLNKGLHYEAFERQFAEREAPQDVPAAAEATPWGVFGPLKFQPDPAVEEQQQVEEEDEDSEADAEYDEEPDIVMIENPRKRSSDRPHHALSHGSPAKRQRLSNGYENGADSATTPMEIDHHPENNHAYPSPLEREQVVSPPLHHTDGPSRGTQVDKTKDLTQDTVFLRLGADNSAEASENPIVLISKWNPKSPSVLATGGTDTLARIWTLQSGSTPDSLPGHVDINSTFRNLNEGFPSDATVTSMAWTSNGEAVALGIEIGNKARLGVWTEDGEVIYRSDDSFDSPITNICWNPTDDLLLAISPDVTKGVANTGTLLHITSPASPDTKAFSRTLDYDLPSFPVDATWINENEFLICGRGLLASFRLADGEIQNVSNFTTGKDERFVFVKYDRRSNLVATASEAGYIDVWDASGQRRQIKAHDGAITAMQWQPQQAGTSDEERLLVSSGVDGTILLWNVLNPENKPKYSITLDSPLAASSLAITPDGTHIAAATHDRVLIWKLGEHSVPKAEWIPQSGWQTPKTESDADENNVSLEWDCIGEKLVYSMDNRLVVLKFR